MFLESLTSIDDCQPEDLSVVLQIPPLNLHPMQTRSKSGIVKKKTCFLAAMNSSTSDLSLIEPSGYKSALKHPLWLNAMKEELDALHSQQTWTLVNLPPDRNVEGCKWIFKIKKDVIGSTVRHKARLVAQGLVKRQALIMGRRLVQ